MPIPAVLEDHPARIDGVLGLRLFLVEQERLASAELEDMLAECGCVVEAIATSVAEALADLASAPGVDAAILNVDVRGQKVFPVADFLTAHGIPVVFAAERGSPDLSKRYPGNPVLLKPYAAKDLTKALTAIARGALH